MVESAVIEAGRLIAIHPALLSPKVVLKNSMFSATLQALSGRARAGIESIKPTLRFLMLIEELLEAIG